MASDTEKPKAGDSGLACLVVLLHCLGIPAEAEQIRHRLGSTRVGTTAMLRHAKELKLKARLIKTGWRRLAATPLPGIAP